MGYRMICRRPVRERKPGKPRADRPDAPFFAADEVTALGALGWLIGNFICCGMASFCRIPTRGRLTTPNLTC
jgi:hypothetical protein